MRQRAEVEEKYRWSVDEMFASVEAWEGAFASFKPKFERLSRCAGSLSGGVAAIKAFLELDTEVSRELDHLYTYAHLKHDENTGAAAARGRLDRAQDLYSGYAAAVSFFEPEFLTLPDEVLDTCLKAAGLGEHRVLLERLRRRKEHVLSREVEKSLAELSPCLSIAEDTFRSFNDTDLKFPEIATSEGQVALSHGNYLSLLLNPDRDTRREAFTRYHQTFASWPNLLASTLSGRVKQNVIMARMRKYPSALSASLQARYVDTGVYERLLQAVQQGIGTHHRYLDLRRRALKLERLEFYDLHLPIVKTSRAKFEADGARQLLLEAFAPLGSEYVEEVRKAFENRWVDWYETPNKRSGAYSSGCYTSHPYILMNFDGTLNSVFTLAHEMGHSLHSLLSRRGQPYPTSRYPIFLAEVASIFNEHLLAEHLKGVVEKPEDRLYILNYQLDQIRTTFVRQTMFADFELAIHREVEAGQALTGERLRELYTDRLKIYFADKVFMGGEIQAEWSRIPHFYYGFYVYQYATGYAASRVLADRVLSGEADAARNYLKFLGSGCSRDPVESLSAAGVDMASPEPVAAVFEKMNSLLDELEPLLGL